MSKMCTGCGIEKPSGDFGKDKSRRDGLKDRCKMCWAEDGARYREDNAEGLARRKAEYYKNNREHVSRYCQDNKERIAAQRAQYRKDNVEMLRKRDRVRRSRDDVKAVAAKRYQDNKVEISRRAAERRKNNKTEILEREAKYREKNPGMSARHAAKYYRRNKEKVYALTAKHRALKINQTPTGADLKIIQLYYAVCSETNEILGGVFFHVDHIQPLSKGGLHHEDNLQILEASLNSQKSDRWPLGEDEHLKYVGVTL